MDNEKTSEKQPIKTLIVEDDPTTQKVLQMGVEKVGFEVEVCSDAEAAWAYYQQETPRLIILDWMLAGMDGVELCKKIRGSKRGKYITILMITAKDQPDDLEIAIKAGVNYYMAKPIHRRFFEAWLSVAEKNVQDLLDLEQSDAKVEKFQQGMLNLNVQLEHAIGRANQMALSAEMAFVELNHIYNNAIDGIRVIDRDFNVIRCNDTFLKIAGVDLEEMESKKCYETFDCSLCNTSDCPVPSVILGQEDLKYEIEKESQDGTKVHYLITATPFRSPDGELLGAVEYILDISDRVKAEHALQESKEKYKELSIIDELTTLFNKRHFFEHLQLELSRAQRYGHPLSILMMDIDDFKLHNDTYGHIEGDNVLVELGKIIKKNIRTSDLGCRYGGEEFVIILPHTTSEDATVVAERIRSDFAFTDFYPKPEEKINKTLSLGITQYIAGEEMESFVKRVDDNLYQAKREGKNRYVVG